MPPLPKKSTERRRRNKVMGEEQREIPDAFRVEQPPLTPGEFYSASAKSWYASLAVSGQAAEYEPSDWQLAIQVAGWITDYDTAIKPPVSLIPNILDGMRHLLVSADSRRRAHLELERAKSGQPAYDPSVAKIEDYRKRLTTP